MAERNLLADAARAVDNGPWPKSQPVSFLSKLTGGDDSEGVSRADAVADYVGGLPEGARFARLIADAGQDLETAERFNLLALHAMGAPRLTMNDVSLVENAIQTVRDHRQTFLAAAKEVEKRGETVDKDQVALIRDAYSHSIKSLGEAADLLADRIDRDLSETYAKPAASVARDSSGL